MLVGDSAGAQISAQVAALITNTAFAGELAVPATINASSWRGVALCCGIFDIAAIDDNGPFNKVLDAVGCILRGPGLPGEHLFDVDDLGPEPRHRHVSRRRS